MTKNTTTFTERVYELTKQIPKGKVATYKTIAESLGSKAYRAVGQALRCNPHASHLVPCHRVVASDASLGGFRGHKAGKDVHDKIVLLRKEGVTVVNNHIENFADKLHYFR